jgi:hypothetical protein
MKKSEKNENISSSERLKKRSKKNSTEFLEDKNSMKEVQEMAVGEENKAQTEEEVKDKVSEGFVEEVAEEKTEEMAKEECSKEECSEEENKTEEMSKDVETEEETAEDSEEEKKEEEFAEEVVEEKEEMAKEEQEGENFVEKYSELLVKYNSLVEEMSEKDTALLSMNAEVMSVKEENEKFSIELESLKSFKAEIEKAEKSEKMKDTFAMLTNVLSKEEIDEWKSKSDKYESVTAFEKDIKSFACYKLLKTKGSKNTAQFISMAVNLDTSEENDDGENETVWSRISKRVAK